MAQSTAFSLPKVFKVSISTQPDYAEPQQGKYCWAPLEVGLIGVNNQFGPAVNLTPGHRAVAFERQLNGYS